MGSIKKKQSHKIEQEQQYPAKIDHLNIAGNGHQAIEQRRRKEYIWQSDNYKRVQVIHQPVGAVLGSAGSAEHRAELSAQKNSQRNGQCNKHHKRKGTKIP